MPQHVLILGGGFGGLTAAVDLKAACGDDVRVTLIDRERDYYAGLTKLWVATGKRTPSSCLRSRAAISRLGIDFVQATVQSIDTGGRSVQTDDASLTFDHLVIALGMEVDEAGVPGIAEHGFNLYSMDGAGRIANMLERVEGHVLLAVCAVPFKCPPAPYEAAMMIKDVVGERASVEVTTPEPRPMPILPPDVGGRVQALLAERDIAFSPGSKLVEAKDGSARYEDGSERSFDALIVVPPHRAATVLADAGLTEPPGLIPVDRETLRTSVENVYAVGDCAKVLSYTDLPIPRAGILAERQAEVVARNIAATIRGEEPTARFEGRGYCFVEVGGGKASKAEGDFLAQPNPVARLDEPSEQGYADKVAFERERLEAWFGTDSA